MTFFAQLDNDNIVTQVTVGVDNVDEALLWLATNLGGRWTQTFEDNYAGVGWTYIDDLGFYPPKPFKSWHLEGITWQAPTPKPEGDYYWVESNLAWAHVDE